MHDPEHEGTSPVALNAVVWTTGQQGCTSCVLGWTCHRILALSSLINSYFLWIFETPLTQFNTYRKQRWISQLWPSSCYVIYTMQMASLLLNEGGLLIIIIIITIIIIIIIICFMQDIYTYIPETNYVPREYSVADTLLLLFMVFISLVSVLNLLYFYISNFRIMCAVPKWLFSVVPWLYVFLVCCSRIFWMTLKLLKLIIIIIIYCKWVFTRWQ